MESFAENSDDFGTLRPPPAYPVRIISPRSAWTVRKLGTTPIKVSGSLEGGRHRAGVNPTQRAKSILRSCRKALVGD